MNRSRHLGAVFWGSLLAALLLALMPFPEALRPLKPFWLGLMVIYWAQEVPERMGLGIAFALGLVGDLLTGALLGEQALRLVVIAFIVLRLRSRLRFFPVPQQAFAVLALLLNDRVVMLMLRAFTGEGMPGLAFWLAPAVGALLWPWLFLLLDELRLKARPREG